MSRLGRQGQPARNGSAPATTVGLLFSDVVGNDPSVIGSGPTVPDESTYEDALAVAERYSLGLPTSVRDYLEAGRDGRQRETPGLENGTFEHVSNVVLVEGYDALDAARSVAKDQGYQPLVLSSRLEGEAQEVGAMHAAIAEEVRATGNPISPLAVLISGGETTVTVRGDGVGGPNQEFGLAAALAGGDQAMVVVAVDTDGIDGASNAAGAIVRPDTVTPMGEAQRALATNDVTTFLAERDALVLTGPTGTKSVTFVLSWSLSGIRALSRPFPSA